MAAPLRHETQWALAVHACAAVAGTAVGSGETPRQPPCRQRSQCGRGLHCLLLRPVATSPFPWRAPCCVHCFYIFLLWHRLPRAAHASRIAASRGGLVLVHSGAAAPALFSDLPCSCLCAAR